MAEMNCGMNRNSQMTGQNRSGNAMGNTMGNAMGNTMGNTMGGMTNGMTGGMNLAISNQSRQALMKQINDVSFAMDDVLLFLDTHPNDADAMHYYHNAVNMRKAAMDAYQRQFGPFFVEDVMGNAWSWVTEKWPWEGGY